MRRALLAVVVTLVLAACGADEPAADVPAGEPPRATGSDLTITVVPADGAPSRVMTLTCDPPGGDHPNAAAACARLTQTDGGVFEPVPAGRACTEIYGGPQTATVTGTYEGRDLDASFSRENGCEIDRWDTLGTEVFDVPLQ